MPLFAIIFLIFVYAFICAALSMATGIDMEYFFYGFPILCLLAFLVMLIYSFTDTSDSKSKKSIKKKKISKKSSGQVGSKIHQLRNLERALVAGKDNITDKLTHLALSEYDSIRALELLYVGLETSNPKLIIELLNSNYHSSDDNKIAEHEHLVKSVTKLIEDEKTFSIKNQSLTAVSSKIISLFEWDKPSFPSKLSLLNVRVVPEGSFLENGFQLKGSSALQIDLLNPAYNVNALRSAANKFRDLAGKKKVDAYLKLSLDKAQTTAKKSVSKASSKNKNRTTASDLKSVVRSASIMCLSKDSRKIKIATDWVAQILEKTYSDNPSKALQASQKVAADFLVAPKGKGDAESTKLIAESKELINNLFLDSTNELKLKDQKFYLEALKLTGIIVAHFSDNQSFELVDKAINVVKTARLNVVDIIKDENKASKISKQLSVDMKKLISIRKTEHRK